MNKADLIFVAGHNGLVGAGLVRELKAKGFNNLLLKTSNDLDLRDSFAVSNFFKKYNPKHVINAAAKVGGSKEKIDMPFTFLIDNLAIQNNIIKYSIEYNVNRLINISSSVVYSNDFINNNNSKIPEDFNLVMDGYSLSKIAGLKAIQSANIQFGKDYKVVIPTNIYGIHDNFDDQKAHVIASAIKKIHYAKLNESETVEIWGDGKNLRDFIYVDDFSSIIVEILVNYNTISPIGINTGRVISIKSLYELIADVIGYKGKFVFDLSKPNGFFDTSLKVQSIQKHNFKIKYSLEEGIKLTYEWFLKNINE